MSIFRHRRSRAKIEEKWYKLSDFEREKNLTKVYTRLLHEGVQLRGRELAAEVLHLLVGDVAAVVLVQGLERQLGSRGHLSLENVKCWIFPPEIIKKVSD